MTLKCARSNCPCTERQPGHPFCCRTCALGIACVANYHNIPILKCARSNCPCTKTAVGYEYCCRTCGTGTACVKNYHK